MKFKLKQNCGSHVQGDREYKAGETIESDLNLASMFRGKFELVHDSLPVSQGKEIIRPAILEKKDVEKEFGLEKNIEEVPGAKTASKPLTVDQAVNLGPDMTVVFLEAKDTKFRIHQKGDGYQIINGSGLLENPDGLLTKDQVNIFLRSRKSA